MQKSKAESYAISVSMMLFITTHSEWKSFSEQNLSQVNLSLNDVVW
jgi:hypothetical protein